MSAINRTGPAIGSPQIGSDGGEIHPVGVPALVANVSVSLLEPNEAAASFNLTTRRAARGVEPLTNLLGIGLTAGSPAWSGDPVPKMRALQKKLLEQGMQLAGEQRTTSLTAIAVVEKNIQLRLRLHQLHMSDLQLVGEREGKKS
jgi:hypothetical protein